MSPLKDSTRTCVFGLVDVSVLVAQRQTVDIIF